MVPSLVFFADEKNEFQEDARLSPKGGAKSALEPVLLSVFSLYACAIREMYVCMYVSATYHWKE